MAKAEDKKRITRVVRVGTPSFWVDLEVLDRTIFTGKQWPGPEQGNVAQETIISLLNELTGNAGSDTVTIKNLPAIGGEHVAIKTDLDIKAKATSKVTSRGNSVKRAFDNSKKNKKRKDQRRRIQFNYISEQHLRTGVPPENPKDYMDAVQKSKDTSRIWLDIAMATQYFLRRGPGGNFIDQGIEQKDTFKGNVHLPHSSNKVNPAPDAPFVRLDPYQVVVNFGPDSLAVEFEPGDSEKKT